jgi:hypothetical protein
MFKRLLGDSGVPDLVTALVRSEQQGTLGVMYIGSPTKTHLPADSGGYSSIGDLVRSVEQAMCERYASLLPEKGIDLQITWYPFGEKEKRKGRKLGLPQDFIVFEVRESPEGFLASLEREGPAFADALRLEGLPDRINQAAQRQWPALAGAYPPGMIRWGRTMTESGFVPEEPFP